MLYPRCLHLAGFGILDDNLKQEITDDSAGPSYANTHEMANKVKTSQEKKANKDKKRKGKGKEGPEKVKLLDISMHSAIHICYCALYTYHTLVWVIFMVGGAQKCISLTRPNS